MNFNFFLQVIKEVIMTPAEFWSKVNNDNPSGSLIINSLLLPFSLLIGIVAFIGSIVFANTHLAVIYSVLYGLQCLAVIIISVYATAFIVSALSGSLGHSAASGTILRLVIISLIPFFLCQSLSRLFESFLFVNILSLYGLYIFWTGSGRLLNPSETGKRRLLIATFLTFVFTYVITDKVIGFIADRLYFSYFA
jgi:hypothetical protein